MIDEKKNVYGENHPIEGVREGDHTVEQDTAGGTDEQFDRVRERMQQEQTSGGMGREGTPKESCWHCNFEIAASEPETPRD